MFESCPLSFKYRRYPTDMLWLLLEQADEMGAASMSACLRGELMRRFPRGLAYPEEHIDPTIDAEWPHWLRAFMSKPNRYRARGVVRREV